MSGITNPSEEYFKDGQWGWDGTLWRKLPLVWGYSEMWLEEISELSADAGTNLLDAGPVPAGEVWIPRLLAARDVNSGCTIVFGVIKSPVFLWLRPGETVAAGVSTSEFQVDGVMSEGTTLRAQFSGCTALDDLYFWIWGYKMKVAE